MSTRASDLVKPLIETQLNKWEKGIQMKEFDYINLTLDEKMEAFNEAANREGGNVPYSSDVETAMKITDDKERLIASYFLKVLPLTESDSAYAKERMKEMNPRTINEYTEGALKVEHAVIQIVGGKPNEDVYGHYDFTDCGYKCDVKSNKIDLTKEFPAKFMKRCVFQVQDANEAEEIYFVLVDKDHGLFRFVGQLKRNDIEEIGKVVEPGGMTPYGQPSHNKHNTWFLTLEDILNACEAEY